MDKANKTDFIIFDVGEMQYAIPIEYIAFIVMAVERFPSCIPPKNACLYEVCYADGTRVSSYCGLNAGSGIQHFQSSDKTIPAGIDCKLSEQAGWTVD